MFIYVNPIYGDTAYGAGECIATYLDFGHDIRPDNLKNFFPQCWSQKETIQIIFEASQNKIEEITIKNPLQKKFECRGKNNLIIDIVFNKENMIISAYPSLKNFRI